MKLNEKKLNIRGIDNGIAINDLEIILDHISGSQENLHKLLSLGLKDLRGKVTEKALEFNGRRSVKYRGIDIDIQRGVDCSGFVTFILDYFGLTVDGIRHANEYFDDYGVFVQNFKPGDLILFSRNGIYPSHIGIVISETEYIHAPGLDDTKIKISKIKEQEIKNQKPGSIYNKNPIGFKRISIKVDDKNKRYNIV